MIGNVHIIGQIGNSYNEDGSILEKGVELIDVVSQIEPLKDCEIINVWINSGGGLISVGDQIAEYLASKPNVVTIADGFCGSIATKIHLSVPLANRKIVAGSQYMIHNPLFSEIKNANANDLLEAVAVLEPLQKGLVDMYVKSTGTSKEAIQSLMNVEASLKEEELLSLGFVSEVINKVQLKAVAFFDQKKVINNQTNMSKVKLSLMALAMAKLKGREVKAIIEETEQGTIETPFSDLMVGDPIMLGTEPAPADTYTLPDGTQLVVVEAGIIAEIIPASEDDVIVDEVLKAEIETLKAENSTLKAELQTRNEAIAQMETIHGETLVVLNQYKAKEVSKYTPPAPSNFQKQKPSNTQSTKELMDARKKEYKN